MASAADPAATVSRKAEHIRINVEEDVSAKGVSSGFERYRFLHCALPEVDLDRVDTRTQLFGRSLSAPIIISCMTGGVAESQRINRTLAEVAQDRRVAIGLGSARALLERPKVLPTYYVRDIAPDVPLLANLGAIQLNNGVGADECRRIVELLEADALVLHLNALQEALQAEGNTNFSGLLAKIEALTRQLEVPVITKEIGWGIAPDLVVRLLDAGVSAVDVAGAGGTSWSEVERHRMKTRLQASVAAAFAGWGIPTAEAIEGARKVAPDALIFASGGVRDGIDVAKAIALGADMVGLAGPFLRAAATSSEAVYELLDELTRVLHTAMFVAGAPDLQSLRLTPRLVSTQPGGLISRESHLHFLTRGALDFMDITEGVQAAVTRAGVMDGMVHLTTLHTTAALCVNENEPLLIDDFRALLRRMAPTGRYDHDDLQRRQDVDPDEPQNGHAHCRQLLLGSTESLPIQGGRIELGQWQRIFLIELDAARPRMVSVRMIGR